MLPIGEIADMVHARLPVNFTGAVDRRTLSAGERRDDQPEASARLGTTIPSHALPTVCHLPAVSLNWPRHSGR